MQGKTHFNFIFGIFLLLLTMASPCLADPVAKLVTLDGNKFEVDHFGSDVKVKDYFVFANKRYYPINEVKNVSRIQADNAAIGYLIILNNGEIHQGRIGFIFYEQVKYKSAHSGQIKTAFVPVMKDRGQDGLVFTIKDVLNQRNKTVEISNPNRIDMLALYSSEQEIEDLALNVVGN